MALCECCLVAEADAELNRASLRAVPAYEGLLGAHISLACWFACGDVNQFAARIRASRTVVLTPIVVKCRGCTSDATKDGCCAYCFVRLNAVASR